MIRLQSQNANAIRGHARTGGAASGKPGVIQAAFGVYLIACAVNLGSAAPLVTPSGGSGNSGDLAVVDCILSNHGQGTRAETSATLPIRIVSATLKDCRARGGEYSLNPDRDSTLRLWLPVAESGDRMAQNRAGEIYENGMGVAPDYPRAAKWYRKAAEQGETRAQVNLAALYEKGLGVPKNPLLAAAWYRRATGLYAGQVSVSRDTLREATGDLRNQEAQLAKIKADLEDLRRGSELDTGK
ncbi:MAG: tetratricopeptide repeat protein [Gammaproteobacteria bacterium]